MAVARAVERFLSEKRPIKKPAVTTPAPQKIEGKPGAKAARMRPRAVEFVSEAEIRAAVKRTEKIVVGKRTIITPAARDLAAEYDVLILEDQDA